MKRFLLLSITALAVFSACQKPYHRKEIQKEAEATGSELRYGLSNCYIAYNKDAVTFDVKAYPVNENNFTTFNKNEVKDAPAADSVGLLWRDQSFRLGDITLNNKEVTVNIENGTSGTFGNAVVAIYHEGEILWSYHIWKPRVDPDSTVHYAELGADVMVLNLGAEDIYYGKTKTASGSYPDRMAGLFYQWGRKDPLGRPALKASNNTYLKALDSENKAVDWDADYASTSTAYAGAKNAWKLEHQSEYPEDAAGQDSLEAHAMEYINKNSGRIIRDWSIKHPTTMIIPSSSYMTFNMVGGENQWKATKGTVWEGDETIRKYWYELKNAYDPCPEGYMLPPMKLYRGFIGASTYIVDDDGDGGNSYSVKDYNHMNTDSKTKGKLSTYLGYNFLYYGSLDSTRTTFYPACGYRGVYSTNGKLTDVGTRGRYHGYTTTVSYIRVFYFTSGELSAQYGFNPQCSANQVRCIKEMTFSDNDEGE